MMWQCHSVHSNSLFCKFKSFNVMLFLTLFVIAATASAYAFYYWATENANYFRKKGLKYVKLTSLSGNVGVITFRKFIYHEYFRKVYSMFPNEKMFGVFDFRTPIFIVRDLELIKTITVKYFNYFEDRRKTVELIDHDPVFFNMLHNLKGEKWRQMRASLTPAFTGSKMRLMFELVADSLDETMTKLKKDFLTRKSMNCETKQLFLRIGCDATTSCTFGHKINSFESPSNVFNKTFEGFRGAQNFLRIIKIFLLTYTPWLASLLKITLISAECGNRFKAMVLDVMDYRQKNNIYRPDAVNMLMQLRSVESTLKQINEQEKEESIDGFATVEESDIGTKTQVVRKWTDDEIVAQCFIFFAAGVETPTNILTFLAYELALNHDVQNKLYAEINETLKKCGGNRIDYDILLQMKYLDQVISEILRKYTSTTVIDRICVKDIEIDCGSSKVCVERGSLLWIPINAMHYDSAYFSDPEKFDPERFSDEKKHQIIPGSYLPFGIGPRNCIGSRFALMEVKTVIVFLLQNFSLDTNEKTAIPMKFKKALSSIHPEGGVNLNVRPRSF